MDCSATLERQAAVHIGFGGVQLRIDEQLRVELAIVQADGDIRPGQAIAEYVNFAAGVADSQGAMADEAPKQIGQQTHVAALRDRPAPYSNESDRGHEAQSEPTLDEP